MAFKHVPDVQVFEGYYAKTVYKFTANLADEIRSVVSNPRRDPFNDI
jgi:hypothetical protein